MAECEGCGTDLTNAPNFCPKCGKKRATAPILIDGRYMVEGELGRGGMGVVYRARDLGLSRVVALKLISPQLVREQRALESFKREARGLAAIRHENVVQVHAFGPHERSFFFVMELVTGKTLDAVIQEHAKNGALVPRERALAILHKVASGLDAVHTASLVHRDVKPENIVIEARTGRPVLIDFGLALQPDKARPVDLIGGSPAYAPLEQLDGSRKPSPQSDLYSFACTAYELLTNDLPFAGASTLEELVVRQARSQFAPPSALRSELAPIDEIFRRALSPGPEARHRSCGELARAIEIKLGAPRETAVTTQTAEEFFAPISVRSAAVRKASFNVLVIDDDPFFAKFAARAVNLAFHGVDARITVAKSGADAIRDAAEHVPNLILLDYDMPEMNGVEVLTHLRALPGGDRARVLVISANAGERERWRFGALGVCDFVSKPILMPGLLEALGRLTKDAGFLQAPVPRRSVPPAD